jgi:hypothetical protein
LSGGVTLRADGKLVATSDAIAKLQRLCREDAEMLRAAETPSPRLDGDEVAFRVTTDDPVEVMLADLMVKSYAEAMKAFALASANTAPGQLVEMRDIHIGQATRLTRAFADLVEARARRRGVTVEHRHQHLHRRVP